MAEAITPLRFFTVRGADLAARTASVPTSPEAPTSVTDEEVASAKTGNDRFVPARLVSSQARPPALPGYHASAERA